MERTYVMKKRWISLLLALVILAFRRIETPASGNFEVVKPLFED